MTGLGRHESNLTKVVALMQGSHLLGRASGVDDGARGRALLDDVEEVALLALSTNDCTVLELDKSVESRGREEKR